MEEIKNVIEEAKSYPKQGVDYFAEVLKYKYFILIFVLVTTGFSVWYSLSLPNWYAATINVIQPQLSQSGGAFSGLSSALKEIGMTSKLSGKSGESYTPQVLFDSRTIKDSIIEMFNLADDYEIPREKISEVRKAFEADLEVGQELNGNYLISIHCKDPVKSRNMVNKYFEMVNNLAIRVGAIESGMNSHFLEKRVEQTDSIIDNVGRLLSAFSSRTEMIQPLEQAKAFSSTLAELKASQIKEELSLELLKKRYGDNDSYIKLQQKTVEELKKQIEKAKNEPGMIGNFSIKNASAVTVEFLKLQAQLETFTKVKSFLMPMLEEARLNERKNMNVFIVLDSAMVPDKKSRPKRSIIVSGVFGSSFALAVVISLLWIQYSNRKRKNKI